MELMGEDLSCYVNTIESVGLWKPAGIEITSLSVLSPYVYAYNLHVAPDR